MAVSTCRRKFVPRFRVRLISCLQTFVNTVWLFDVKAVAHFAFPSMKSQIDVTFVYRSFSRALGTPVAWQSSFANGKPRFDEIA